MFGSNFVEKDKTTIEIQGVDPDAMAVLLQSVQRKEVDILKSNDILSVLQASSMLQFESIQKTCVEMIVHKWLTISTCLQTMVTAEELDLITLHHKARALALWEFTQVKDSDAFLELTISYLEKYLRSDGLNITGGEFEVLEAGLCWLQDKPFDRKEYVCRVLDCIRFADIPASDMKTILLYPVISENMECLNILQCILYIKEGKNPEEMCIVADPKVEAQTSRNCSEGGETLLNGEENYVSKKKKAKQCKCIDKKSEVQSCQDRGSILNNCCSCCSAAGEPKTPVYGDELTVQDSSMMKHDDHIEFSTETIATAKRLLSTPSRSLPLLPCVIGHKINRTDLQRKGSNHLKESRKVTVDDGKPYLIYFQQGRPKHPVPFLHLSKANEGLLEPTGYKVICRGQDLYMIGGEYLLGYGNWNKSIWRYDVLREMWNFETSIASPRRHHSACCLGDYIYIIGGFGRHRVIMDSVEKYHVGSKCWSRCASLPHNLYSAACCTFKEQIFVLGPQVYFYHPSSDSWFIMSEATLPPNTAFNCAMPYDDWIYLTGTYSRELLRFSPQFSGTEDREQTSRFESLGHFWHNTSNTCLVHDVIYSFSTDDFGNMFVEAYSITEMKFSVLWSSFLSEQDNNDISDFSPKHCIGCFPLIKY